MFHSAGYYLILLWMSVSIGFFMVQCFFLVFVKAFFRHMRCTTLLDVTCFQHVNNLMWVISTSCRLELQVDSQWASIKQFPTDVK